jgi:hypothetical protein
LECEDELVRGILCDPPRDTHHIALEHLVAKDERYRHVHYAEEEHYRQARSIHFKPLIRRVRRVRRRLDVLNKSVWLHDQGEKNKYDDFFSACALLKENGAVDVDAPVLALTGHPATATFASLVEELTTRFAPPAIGGSPAGFGARPGRNTAKQQAPSP